MTKDVFFDTFSKLYPQNTKIPYVFKMPYSIALIGGEIAETEHRLIGTNISPDCYIGIRLCDSGRFYIRSTDSNIMYECSREKLSGYNENNWAKKIFRLLSRMNGSININGAEILFHSDCNRAEFRRYSMLTAYAFAGIFCSNLKPADILGFIPTEESDYKENALRLMTVNAEKNKIYYVENGISIPVDFVFDGYKTVLISAGSKFVKQIDFEKVLGSIRDTRREFTGRFSNIGREELHKYKSLPEYPYMEFAVNEGERIFNAGNCVKKGDIKGLGKIIKDSAREYFSLLRKDGAAPSGLFDIAENAADVCGAYGNFGIYAILPDAEVDSFMSDVGKECERKTGMLPEFYVCGSSFGGVVLKSS